MSYFNFLKRSFQRDTNATLKCTSPDLVNRLYKPKTLGELKAEMIATGINPAPVALRSALPEVDGFDNIDAPAVQIGGDVFENLRSSIKLQKELEKQIESAQKFRDLKDHMEQKYGEESKDKSPEQ